MKCDVCGSDNLEGAAYCEDCGAKLVVTHAMAGGGTSSPPPPPPVEAVAPAPPVAPVAPVAHAAVGASVQCPSCGADNPSSEAYCVDCGANLNTSAAPTPVSHAPVAAPPTPHVAHAAGRLALASGGKQWTLDKEITTMGRRSPADQIEPDVDMTDDDPESYVSRRHAQILRNDDHYVFEDVGSSNGSFINNAKVQPGVQQILKNGDKLRLGKTEFVFNEA